LPPVSHVPVPPGPDHHPRDGFCGICGLVCQRPGTHGAAYGTQRKVLGSARISPFRHSGADDPTECIATGTRPGAMGNQPAGAQPQSQAKAADRRLELLWASHRTEVLEWKRCLGLTAHRARLGERLSGMLAGARGSARPPSPVGGPQRVASSPLGPLPRPVPRPEVPTQGVRRWRSRGNRVVERMLSASTTRAVKRSRPMAKPPWGGMPWAKTSR
jgi:hypothetical protein